MADTFFLYETLRMKEFDENIIDSFKKAKTERDLAEVLNTPYKILKYNLYVLSDEQKYNVFEIKKRNGGIRQISAPISGIKKFQKKISEILNHLHKPKHCAHGYVIERSIKTNAEIHVNKRIVINIDLKDFFTSINFGRVRGLFLKYPFSFTEDIATLLAQICCFNGTLPQGAPSSPILSNYICWRLDNQLLSLAKKYKINYSRYADDITFSTNLKKLPKEIGTIVDNTLCLSSEFISIIENNGFKINYKKVRFALKNNRQEVTGLIVNKKVNINRKYIRHVRSIIHAWEKFGLEEAAREHFEKYNYKQKVVENHVIAFYNEIFGKINYIRYIKGDNNSVYKNLYKRIKALDSTIKLPVPKESIDSNVAIVFCEGKTDGIHLDSALSYFKDKGQFIDLNIHFFKYDENEPINNDKLLSVCENRNLHKKGDRIEIYLFDRDVPRINNKVSENGSAFKHWGKNIYSLLLPIPAHRKFDEICIEQYYTDDEIKTKTKKGWRLYLSTEFDENTGKHLTESNVIYTNTSYLKAPYPRIIDDKVRIITNDRNIALSKKVFAESIANKRENFKTISPENFSIVFEKLEEILQTNTTHHKPSPNISPVKTNL